REPTIPRNQRPYPAVVYSAHGQINQRSAGLPETAQSAQNVNFLANHDAPTQRTIAVSPKSWPLRPTSSLCFGSPFPCWLDRQTTASGSILVCAFRGGSDGRRPLRPAKSGRCWNEDGSRS